MTSYLEKNFGIANKTILVTGASRGIGEAIALACKRLGANLVCIARSPTPNLEELKSLYVQCDIENILKFKNIIETTSQRFGGIDALVNVAGQSLPGGVFPEQERFSKTLKINLEAVYHCCETVYPELSKNGSIVNIGSIGSILGFPKNPGYVSSKGGLRMLTKALAIDYSQKNVRVNCILPGYIKTEMTRQSFENRNLSDERLARMIIKRWGEPADIVGAAVFLISDASQYITGTDIVIDGGWSAKGL